MLLALLTAGCLACPVQAAPRRVPLSPTDSHVAFRAYGMGLLPIDATFSRFEGWLTYDPDDQRSCQVDLRVQVASLVTEDAALRDRILGPDFMDVSRYPLLTYAGACRDNGLGGLLAMHGVTRPFELSLDWTDEGVVAEGRLVRADWGMTERPLLGGRTVRIRVAVPLAGSQKQGSHRGSTP